MLSPQPTGQIWPMKPYYPAHRTHHRSGNLVVGEQSNELPLSCCQISGPGGSPMGQIARPCALDWRCGAKQKKEGEWGSGWPTDWLGQKTEHSWIIAIFFMFNDYKLLTLITCNQSLLDQGPRSALFVFCRWFLQIYFHNVFLSIGYHFKKNKSNPPPTKTPPQKQGHF